MLRRAFLAHRYAQAARACGLRFACLALFALAFTNNAAAQLAQSPQPGQANAAAVGGGVDYVLGAGDRVSVTVFRHEDLSGEFEVDHSGAVGLPLIGQIQAAGRTAPQVEAAIIAKLKPDYLKNPRVSVQVLSYRPFYIIGEVRAPGSYPYVSGLTVLQAVALAGGFTYRAREDKLSIQRAGDPTGAKRPVQGADAVLPGDVIEVRERYF